ncbi:MAG: CarD family transcriptional regulator [Candidatus Tantalella remota]|nr:CarD family transcriptional regulator [Candidatus Tantalella remota]
MFKVGELVMHPANGICRIVGIKEDSMLGGERVYVLKPRESSCGKFSIFIPCSKSRKVGIRNLLGSKEIDDILRILWSKTKDVDNSYKDKNILREIIKTGDIYRVAHVIRNLEKDTKTELPKEIKPLVSGVKMKLVDEIAYVKKISEQRANDLIENSLMKNR